MAGADGTIVIDIDIPVNKVRTDSQDIKAILNAIGDHAGDKLDSHFKENTEKVKRDAESTSREVNSKLDKEVKTKYSIDDSEADGKIDKIHARIRQIPKDQQTDFTVKDHSSGALHEIKNRLLGIRQESEKAKHTFRDMFLGSTLGGLTSNLISSAWGHITGGIHSAIDAAKQYALEQQTMLASWTTLTGSAKKGQAMVDMTNKMAIAANNSTKMVDQLNQKLFAVTNSASETGKLTHSILTLQDAFGASDAAIANFSVQYAQMIGNGKAQAMDMMSIQNVFPKFKEELLDYMQLQTHNHKLTMQQLNDMMSHGKITSDIMNNVLIKMAKQYSGATTNFTKTIPGMFRTIESTMPTLLGKISEPLAKAANPIIGTISNWITSKDTEKEFEKIGTTTAQGMNKVVSAFAGNGSSSKQLIDSLNGSLEHLNKWLGDTFTYIADHAKDFKQIGSDLWTIVKILGKSVWSDYVTIISSIADAIGLTGDNASESHDPLKQLSSVIHGIAKHQGSIKAIAAAIASIAAIKTLDKVLSPLKAIANLKVGKGTVLDLLKNGITGTTLKGALQSVKSAGGIKEMTVPGKLALGASIFFNATQIYSAFNKAINDKSLHKKWEDIGSGVGGILGTAIGAYFGGSAGALLGDQIGSKIGASAGVSFGKAFSGHAAKYLVYGKKGSKSNGKYDKTAEQYVHDDYYNLSKHKRKQQPLYAYDENGYYDLKTHKYHDQRSLAERSWGMNHRLNYRTFAHPNNAWDLLSGGADLLWNSAGHIGDKDFWHRSSAGIKKEYKGSWLDWSGFFNWVRKRKPGENRNYNPLANPTKKFNSWIGNQNWDWGWLDPKQNGLDKWLAGFKPQVHGKVPSLSKLKLNRSSILPNIDIGKWWKKNVTDKLKQLKWPKLPKWHIKMPEFHPIKWIKSKLKGFKWPKLPKFNIASKIKSAVKAGKGHLSKFNGWIGKSWNGLKKNSSKVWNKIKDSVIKNAEEAKKSGSKNFSKLQSVMGDVGKDIKKQWHSLWNGLADFFENVWKSIKKTASGGINGVVGVINGGISGIDNVIHSFGGKSHAIGLIPKVKLATGTLGNLTPSITQPTLALLNDGHDSPETGNKETIWDTKTGALGVVNGTNVPFLLQPGMEVFSASQSRDLGFTHFAKGTNPLAGLESFVGGLGSWISQKGKQLKKWFDLATKIVTHPLNALDNLMKPSSKDLNGIFVQLGKGMFDKSKDAAKEWWSALWNMASSKLNGDGGPATGLLKAVEKYGEGHKYVWGAAGPTTFDCSGLVMYALKHAYGIDFPHFSGAQYAMTQHISKDQARMGDLVFWGDNGGEHVGVYDSGNKYFSAESPSQGIHMNTLDSVVGKGKPLFGRVRGLSQSSSKKDAVKATNSLQKMIKDQVGNGFFKFLSKLGDLFGFSGTNALLTGDHSHWLKQAGIPRSEYPFYNYIISHESGWNPKATNPKSGAYGLPQSLPAGKMASAGSDWRTNPITQLKWMKGYVKSAYGGIRGAYRFWLANHAYGNGGITSGPELAVVGEDGIERIINVMKPSADALIDNTIKARAQVAPESPSGKLAKLIDFNSVKYSSANGYGMPQDSRTRTVINQVGSNQSNSVDGDVYIDVHADSAKLARVIYPKVKILQGKDLDIAGAGGAIS